MNKVRVSAAVVALAAAGIVVHSHTGVNGQIKACHSNDGLIEHIVIDCIYLLERNDISDQTRANALFRRAFLMQQQDPNMAEADYLAVLEIRPDWTWALNNLGNLYINLNRPADALPYYTRALEVEPDAHHRRSNRARTFYGLERYEEALADLVIVLTAHPDSLWDMLMKARCLRELGDHDGAVEVYSRIIQLDSEYGSTLLERARVYHRHLDLLDEAEADLRQVLESEPGNKWAAAELGYVLLDLNRPEEAKVAFEAALKIDQEYRYALRGLERISKAD